MAPWNTVLELLKAAMAERGMLEATAEKKLKIFTVTHYTLPERTARLVKGQPVAPVKAMLESCQRARPEVWKELEEGSRKRSPPAPSQVTMILTDGWRLRRKSPQAE